MEVLEVQFTHPLLIQEIIGEWFHRLSGYARHPLLNGAISCLRQCRRIDRHKQPPVYSYLTANGSLDPNPNLVGGSENESPSIEQFQSPPLYSGPSGRRREGGSPPSSCILALTMSLRLRRGRSILGSFSIDRLCMNQTFPVNSLISLAVHTQISCN